MCRICRQSVSARRRIDAHMRRARVRERLCNMLHAFKIATCGEFRGGQITNALVISGRVLNFSPGKLFARE